MKQIEGLIERFKGDLKRVEAAIRNIKARKMERQAARRAERQNAKKAGAA